ncbi:hypothetical protein Dtox_2495 [Desulfofarcimen acetoxidans DSM 771]|uniref:Uncharacterized protein n=1 Tax=Desulfofarcimen acetoxidans (strain ATCC 49208 / DSM 771 / KCTC 5769 / VKM B-1644 / 5575) TaxID=485916 RepID=C8W0P6_DESAS|nr:hypothetical protein [Desulfofarcimen acetoxidans]ACV63301.1 hypothetical protein Dtox_2495 [Desulfofarcimen acetoxidans DSM 771]
MVKFRINTLHQRRLFVAFFIFTLFLLSTGVSYAGTGLEDALQALNLPSSISVQGKMIYARVDGNRIVYGNPGDVIGVNPAQQYKDGQYRYLGYTYTGEPFTNQEFPNDDTLTTWEQRNWISQPWDKQYKLCGENDEFIPDSSWDMILSQVPPIIADPSYLKVLSEPLVAWINNDLVAAVGSVRVWHKDSSGKIWYETFNIDPTLAIGLKTNNDISITIDSGVPKNTTVKPGDKFTGHATLLANKISGNGSSVIPVNIYQQLNSQGTYIQQKITSKNTSQTTFTTEDNKRFNAYSWIVHSEGDTITFDFDWICPDDVSKIKFTAGVNLDYPGESDQVSPAESKMQNVITETDYGNNKAWVEVPIGDISAVPIIPVDGIDIEATSIDSGVPSGTNAQPGKTYTGKAIFTTIKLPAPGEYHLPVNIYHQPGGKGTYYQAKIKNLKLSTFTTSTGTTFSAYELVIKKQGDTVEVIFDWTCPAAGKTKLVTATNLDYPGDTDQVSPVNGKMSITTTEADYSNNKAWVELQTDYQNLWVEILEYPTSVQTSTNTTVKARIHNDRGELLTTRLVWKVNGNIIKDIQNYDVIGTLDAGVSFTMPSNGASVTVEVNPDRDRPSTETSFIDNKASCYINAVAVPTTPSDGSSALSIDISAPAAVEAFKSWKYTVEITTYFKKPKVSGDEEEPSPPTITMNVNATGQSADTNVDYNYDTGYQKIIPVTKTAKETFSAGWGKKTHTYTYTHPGTGLWGQPTSVIIKATAAGGSKNATDTAKVQINPLSIPNLEIQLYQ